MDIEKVKMGYELLEQIIKGSEIQVQGTKVLDHFLHVELDNCNVLIIQMDNKYEISYVAVYIYSKRFKYVGKFATPELNLLTYLRTLSNIERLKTEDNE